MSGTASSSMSSRCPVAGKSYPYASASHWCQPAPSPNSNRPLEMWSMVVAALASSPGFRYADAEHQAAEPGLACIGGQRAEGGHGLEVIDGPARRRCFVQVVPDRDPVHAGVVEPAPQRPQPGHGQVLLADVHPERDTHGTNLMDRSASRHGPSTRRGRWHPRRIVAPDTAIFGGSSTRPPRWRLAARRSPCGNSRFPRVPLWYRHR